MVAAKSVVQDCPVSDAGDVGARNGDVYVTHLAGWMDKRSGASIIQNDEVVFFDEFFQ